MGLSFGHLIVVLLIVMVLFGFGKLPKAMGDIGKGIRNLRDELNKDADKEKQQVLPPKDKE
jgi:sec-independent protein translocase protein TatA